MPNETDIKNNGGDGGDAAAKAVADKAIADKAAADKIAADDAAGEESVSIKKSELEKIKSDRDNYRDGLLKKKADERSLDKKGGDDQDKGGGVIIDEARVTEIAKTQASAVLADTHKSNENRAKLLIVKKYGELIDDANWIGFISHFNGKRGKATVEDIIDDFEDAMLLYKRNTGKLDEHLKSEAERARREGRIEGQMDAGRGGDAGDKNEGGKGTGILTPKGEEMARAMHVDLEKVKKVDISKDNVIDVIK